MMVRTVQFFFNESATTEIYTYVHTLSLLDALPIYRKTGSSMALIDWPPGHSSPAIHSVNCARSTRFMRRSEEHTSELQSLMRTSYAVFCLNKKIDNSDNLHKLCTHQIQTFTYNNTR